MTDWADDNLGDDIDEKLPEPTEVDKGDQRIKISYKWRHNEQDCFYIAIFENHWLVPEVRYDMILRIIEFVKPEKDE